MEHSVATDWCSGQVVDAAMKVHSALGPGLLEAAYESCLEHELRKRGCSVARQVLIPLEYENVRLDAGYVADLIVNDRVIVELKAVAKLLPIHAAQLISYLRLGGFRVGLLINFHEPRLKDGLKRYVDHHNR